MIEAMLLLIVVGTIIKYADLFIIEFIAVFIMTLVIVNYPIIQYKRKIKMYKMCICDEYGLDSRILDAVQIEPLERYTGSSELVGKMLVDPPHWLYSCKDGSRDLRYTKSNRFVPESWFITVKAHDMYYFLISNNKASIEQIECKINENLVNKQ